MSQNEADTGEEEIGRVRSLVPGLDQFLCGGFLEGGLSLVQGSPGIGKTVLASQITYRRAAEGHRALFITVLGESHGRMLAHLRPMRFFDPSLNPAGGPGPQGDAACARRPECDRGQGRRRDQVRDEAVHPQPADPGLGDEMHHAADQHSRRKVGAGAHDGGRDHRANQRAFDARSERRLLVHKLRGSDFLEGKHTFRITREGAFDPPIREFEITSTGIIVDKPFEGVEAVLSGMAREVALRGAAVAPSSGGTRPGPANDTVPPG